jgi:hypothetical protein
MSDRFFQRQQAAHHQRDVPEELEPGSDGVAADGRLSLGARMCRAPNQHAAGAVGDRSDADGEDRRTDPSTLGKRDLCESYGSVAAPQRMTRR